MLFCDRCLLTFQENDAESHNGSCTVNSALSGISANMDWPALSGSVLLGKTRVVADKLRKPSIGKFIRLHPDVLQKWKIPSMAAMVINNTTVVRCITDDSLQQTSIGLYSELAEELNVPKKGGSLILVYPVQDLYNEIVALKIRCRNQPDVGFIIKQNVFLEHLQTTLVGQYIHLGQCIDIPFFGQVVHLKVTSLDLLHSDTSEHLVANMQHLHLNSPSLTVTNTSHQFYLVTKNSRIELEETPRVTVKAKQPSFAGYQAQKQELEEYIKAIVCDNKTGWKSVCPPIGFLLFGPSGCGKALLCQCLAHHYNLSLLKIIPTDVTSKSYGDSEQAFDRIYKEVCRHSPCLVHLEDVDLICPRRDRSGSDTDHYQTAACIKFLDQLVAFCRNDRKPVIIIATSNKADNIDPGIRRVDRLERDVELGVPSSADREKILGDILQAFPTELSRMDVSLVSACCHGYLGCDLYALSREGFQEASRRSEQIMTKADLLSAQTRIKPTVMKEVTFEVPKVTWSDIGGQEDLKHKLRQAVEWPLKHPEAFQRLGIKPPKGLLMYGPPGCSKTMIAKALARESGLNFISIKGPELFSKWVGESERAVREVFRRARTAAPAIVFFDEIDALATHRASGADVSDRVLAQLLTEIDGVAQLKDVTILAATNRPDRIDKALLRPGRLDRLIYVSLPNDHTRREILTIHLRSSPVEKDVCVDALVTRTKGYSGAEMAAICQEAALCALKNDIHAKCIGWKYFEEALKIVTPRISAETIAFYENYSCF